MDTFTCFSILLLTMSIQTGRNKAIQIEINPATYDKIIHDEVNITCTPDGHDKGVKTIMILEIVKANKPIVVKHRGLKPSFPNGTQTRFVATGQISIDNVTGSYLRLTLESYEIGDSGLYSCVMYFVDEIGLIKMEKSSMNLTEERTNVKTLENALTFMKNKIVKMEHELKERDSAIMNNISSLADKDSAIMNNISSLADKDCDLDVILYVNNNAVARLFTRNKDTWDQSSVSTVAELKPGDKVFSFTNDNGCTLLSSKYSVFTGYLLRAL